MQVTVIGTIQEHQQKDTKTNDVPLASTPRRKQIYDHSDTPVPGCINDSYIDKGTTKANKTSCRGQLIHITSIANNQHFTVMKNMETALETVLSGVYQSKKDNRQLKMIWKIRRNHPAGDVLWIFVEPGNVVP